MNILNTFLKEIENFEYKDQIIEYVNKIRELILLNNLKPFEYYQKFNLKLTIEDYNNIKTKLINELNKIIIDDYLNINCKNCLNCYCCYDCNDCNDCKHCNDCDKCEYCNDCDNCNNCKNCYGYDNYND